MKSLVHEILSIAQALLTDATAAYPFLRNEFSRDFERLTLESGYRGLGYFTLRLPELDDLLLQGLEHGSLPSHDFKKVSKKVHLPCLYRGLWRMIFTDDGCLKDDADTTAIAFLRQLTTVGKKILVPCSKKRELAAIKEFVYVDSQIRRPSLDWMADSLSLDGVRLGVHLRDCLDDDLPLFPDESRNGSKGHRTILLERCQRVADILSAEIGPYYPDEVVDLNQCSGSRLGLRHGPGAVAERTGKFDKNIFSAWSAKLSRLFPFSAFGKMPNDPRPKPRNHEVPSRLISVAKTAKSPRLIAAEPTEHQFCQQLTLSFLESRINTTFIGKFINFRKQELSADMVKSASLDRELATIDLSSASDRLSCWTVERVFRKNVTLLDGLHATRTRYTYVPQLGEYVKLNKFATQGTAVTFPIQSLVFLSIAITGSLTEGHWRKLERLDDREIIKAINGLVGKVRVFGDDIIIPTHGYVRVTQLLHDLGLKVNLSKSFYKGHFRESCGMDAYKGDDVTPCKPQRVIPDKPASAVGILDTSNNLFYKGYWHAAEYLRYRHRRNHLLRFPTVGRDAGSSGWRSFLSRVAVTDKGFGTLGCMVQGGVLSSCNSRSHYDDRLLQTARKHFPNVPLRFEEDIQQLSLLVRTVRTREIDEGRIIQEDYSGPFSRQFMPEVVLDRFGRNRYQFGSERRPDGPPRVVIARRWVPLISLL